MTNAFNILCPLLKERGLTETLRYFLDSSESHALGDTLVRTITEWATIKLPNGKLNVIATSEWATDTGREIDIVATIRKSWDAAPLCILGIEAKISSKESASQISDYQKALIKAFPKIPKRLLFITPSGYPPNTADKDLDEACPAISISWNDVAACLSSHCHNSRTAVEFADYLKVLVGKNQNTANDSEYFFKTRVLPQVNKKIQKHSTKSGMTWAWENAMDEFNYYHTENDIGDGFRLIWMLYSPQGPIAIGRQIHLVLMAYCYEGFTQKDENRLIKLQTQLPPREGRRFQWGPWKFLWSAGCRTLIDLDKQDEDALVSMLARAYITAQPLIDRAVAELWFTEKLMDA